MDLIVSLIRFNYLEMNEAIKKVKLENEVVKARTDSKAELIEPIDFSFKDLMKFEGWKFYMKLFFY